MAKIFKNMKTKIQVVGDDSKPIENALYSDLLKQPVNSLPTTATGVPIPIEVEEMRKRTRLLDQLELSKNGNIILENADAEKLQELVKNHKWFVINKEIVEMVDAVAEMKEYKKR